MLREVITAWVLMMSVLLVILLVFEVSAVLERAAASQFPSGVILRLIYLGVLQYVSLVAPMGLLLGIVWAFGRLYHDTEMAAALACGVHPATLFVPVAVLGLAVASALAAVTLVLAPSATYQALTLRNEAVRAGRFAPLQAGQFRAFGGGKSVVYAEKVQPDGTLENVFVERTQGSVVEVALASKARHTVSPGGEVQTIKLYDGERFEGVPGSPEFRIMHFAEHTVPIRMPPVRNVVTDPDAQPTVALLASSEPRLLAVLQWRIALPLMCFVLAVVALPLSKLEPRQGRYARIWLAVVVYVVYVNLLVAGKMWIKRGTIPVDLGLWWVHAAAALFALALALGPSAARHLRYRPART